MSRYYHRQEFLDLYCCLPDEFLLTYPQPRLSFYDKQKKKNKYRNTNAFKPTSSTRLSKSKSKNFLHSYKISKDHYANDTHNFRKEKINRIMSIESIDQEVEFYMIKEPTKSVKHHYHSLQMADGDKKIENFRQQRFINERECMIHDDIIRPIPCKPTMNHRSKPSSNIKSFKNSISDLSSSQIYQSTLPLNHTSTCHKLQANIISSHCDHIEQFQQECQQQHTLSSIPHPIMLSPSKKQSIIENYENSNITNSYTLLSIDSSINLTDSNNTNHRIIQSIDEDQQILDNNDDNKSNKSTSIDNEIKLVKNDSFPNRSIQHISSLQEIENIEIISPSQVPSILLNNIFSSFFPTISPPLTLTLSSSSSSFIESIQELCLLIRQLLQNQLTDQKKKSLQTILTNQLAILLTYLAIPKNENFISNFIKKDTIEKMTSTNEDDIYPEQKRLFFTIGTQTDLQSTEISKSIHDLIEFNDQNKEEKILDVSSSKNVPSHTELISTSVTLHLPGRRLNHALSDTFIYHNYHQQQYSSSYHHLNSFSETNIYSLMQHYSTKEKRKYLLKCIKKKFQHFIELESSNTCLEGSTEFTPDFLLTTINNSKYDNDQTEHFGIDTDKQDYQTDTISLIIKKNQEKIDTLTFNSTEKENYDSLELDIEQDNDEHSPFSSFDINKLNVEENDEVNSLFLNNSSSVSVNNDLVSPIINQFDNSNNKYFCQLLQPLFNTFQWQLPILPRKMNSNDLIYQKRTAKINLKYMKVRSNSNSGINIIGKRVQIKSNSSSRVLTSSIKSHSYKQQSRILFTLNNNNNYADSIQSSEISTSIVDTRLSSTTSDNLCSINSSTSEKSNADQYIVQSKNLPMLTNHSESDELIVHSSLPNIHQSHDSLIQTISSSATVSSYLSDVTDNLDSNIALAQNLLDMLDSFNNNNNNNNENNDNKSSTINISLLHMYIRQFLVEFDARIRLERTKKMNCRKRHKKVIH